MERNSSPAWLGQVREISKSPATEQALAALKNATTLNELAIAEQEFTGAVLAAIAADMAREESNR